MQKKRKLIIDCDAGLDDAQAIFMALSNPDVEVVAITTCHGNVDVDQIGLNVLRILKVVDRHQDLPVYRGASTALAGRSRVNSSHYHGLDGLGDVPDVTAPGPELIQPEHAAMAIPRLVRQHSGEITLVCLAPLTNIALALRLDPGFPSSLKECFVMGGNYEGKGNATTSAEFNFFTDPEAAAVVLAEMTCQMTLICWELCMQHSFSWIWHEDYSTIATAKGRFIQDAENNTIMKYYKNADVITEDSFTYCTADQLAMACCIHGESTIQVKDYVKVDICTNGVMTAGQLVILGDIPPEDANKGGNICLIKRVNHENYGELLKATLMD